MALIRLISITPDAQKQMLYCARVSNPKNQDSDDTKLLGYCLKHGHWSVFEMAHMTVEIETSRAIAAQLLRHRSFSFQEFSQRYQLATLGFESFQARSQDAKNRQASHDDMSEETKRWFLDAQAQVNVLASELYGKAIDLGIAKEQARALLPLSVKTRLYMTGSVRSWIHYCQVRCHPSTQAEHRAIAESVKELLRQATPAVAELL